MFCNCKDNTGLLSFEEFYPALAQIVLQGSNCHAEVAATGVSPELPHLVVGTVELRALLCTVSVVLWDVTQPDYEENVVICKDL